MLKTSLIILFINEENKFFELSFLIVLFLSIYLTFEYNWWSNGNLKVQDYILPILFTTYFFKR